MDAAYLKAAHPEPHTILGQRLYPFCLGHELLFQRFGNKFSIESIESPTIEDMLTGVYICSQPYLPTVSMDGFKIPFGARIKAKIFGRAYLENAFRQFRKYIDDHTEIPEFYVKDDAPEDSNGVATIQAVKVSLMSNMGMPEIHALNVSFSLAFWNHLTWLAAQGIIKIVDAEELAKRAYAKSQEEWIDNWARTHFPNGYNGEEVSLGA